MKSVFRNFLFVLKRFKTSSILNLIGLSAAFAVFTVTLMQVYYDYSFNRNFSKSNRIFNFSIQYANIHYNNMNVPLLQKIGTSFPEVKSYCILYAAPTTVIKAGDAKYNDRFMYATSGLMDVFEPEIVSGHAQDVFTSRRKVMIPESSAKKYFGNKNPLGQVIFVKDSVAPFTVVAVYRDFPQNCLLRNLIYAGQFDVSPYNYSFRGYFEIAPAVVPGITEKLNTKQFLGEELWNRMNDDPKSARKIGLTPVASAHFLFPENEYLYFDGEPPMSVKALWSLLAIGIVTLLIAYINFLNFSVALAPARVKNLNIQKIMGASQGLIRMQIVGEAILFSLLAFLISLVFVYLFVYSSASRFFTADMSFPHNLPVLGAVTVLSFLFGLFSGLYPAFYITAFRPAVAINGLFAFAGKNSYLRNCLIAIQFIAAITLLITAIFIKNQYDFMRSRPTGISKENILFLPTGPIKTRLKVFAENLKANPHVIDYAASSDLPGKVSSMLGENFEGKQVMAYWWSVSDNFLRFFGVKVVDGRDFTAADSAGVHGIIFNQNFLKKYSMQNINGKQFGNHSFKYDYRVVGIASDVNFLSLRDSIYPMAFSADKGADFNWLYIKITGREMPATIDFIKNTWKKYSDENFDLKFLDNTIDELYKNEMNLAKLISLFSLIAILIAVMGVYGLVVFNTRYRAKEIALRKVNGASIPDVMLMLNRNILVQFAVAFVVSVPLAYYIVHRWLEQFAYKTPVYWWVFLLAGVLVFLVTVMAVSMQSYRAATANPVEAIKRE